MAELRARPCLHRLAPVDTTARASYGALREYLNRGDVSPVARQASVRKWYARTVWARIRRTGPVLPVVALALLLPVPAAAAGSGGMPSPDPSTQIAPDPAPSGGEIGSHGAGGQAPQQHTSTPSTPSTGQSTPASAGSNPTAATAPTSTGRAAATSHRKAHRRHAAATHRRAHHATSGPQVKVEAAQRRPATFATTLDLALHMPVSAPAAAAATHGLDDIFLLASIALLLFVFGGLMVVRSSAEVMRRERPA
jgi:hypothetical protein